MSKKTGKAAQASGDKVKVLVVDDSQLMCRILEKILSGDPRFEVVGQALSGKEALRMLSETDCDVITLDVEMPEMNGLTALKHIMIKQPKPTLMVSAFTAEGAKVTFDALRYGAVDFFQKPSQEGGGDLEAQADVLRSRILRASRVQVGAARYLRLQRVAEVECAEAEAEGLGGVAVMATSTGGYASLLSVLPQMCRPPKGPLLISMGTPAAFLGAFVDYVNPFVPFPVERAGHESLLRPGHAYVLGSDEAPAIEQRGDGYYLLLGERTKDMGDEGGVDLLLFSASEHFGDKVLAVFLSGDGTEGLSGAKEVKRTGGRIQVQRPETCLCPELPRKVLDEVDGETLATGEIAHRLENWCGPEGGE
ncbi:response regulator [Dissulfurirhabdus thermomarina]|uniref:protein-glutamate methylesterase n=1 Tax=Dissulfurirhabdus thermomarina TaxID=1765737 RepID=A0A6N9TKJ0_DISTH|nr:chemotaxis protein CheB [Dissulfurirhabdus thermomarina]NDY41782.1 response regulator [Dissulfurirhabdus thermomarina]NMX23976.1 response regulator [Dissulfurirhabdus thermomarina]